MLIIFLPPPRRVKGNFVIKIPCSLSAESQPSHINQAVSEHNNLNEGISNSKW